MGLGGISRLAFTVRHLTPEQVLFQIYYRARPLRVEPVGSASRRSSLQWQSPTFQKPSTADAIRFSFLGVEGEVPDSDWNAAQHDKLWLYNLHYLDDLNSIGADERNALAHSLVNRWIEANPPPVGIGWEPYPLSLRIVNLVKWFGRQPTLAPHWLPSLATQLRALAKQVEYHIQGNHLFANAKALAFGGTFLAGSEADRWLTRGLGILDEEISNQFLADGAHFELSPMYHAALLWDMCDLVNLVERAELVALKSRMPTWRAVIQRGLAWLRSMLHPDGDIPFFNDAAFGIAPTLRDLEAYAAQLGGCLPDAEQFQRMPPIVQHHVQSGYASVTLGQSHKALLDLARVGPDHQPGHAHADTLSFELSLFGQRIFVNSGTSVYGQGAERHRQRSTAAHNTVEVMGENSSEVWAGFRVARRAYPIIEAINTEADGLRIRASHTGYYRLKGHNVHRREWLFTRDSCEITDEVTGPHDYAIARLHLHPAVVVACNGSMLEADLGAQRRLQVVITGARSVELSPSTWHPYFGSAIATQCITAEFRTGKLETKIHWEGSD